MRPTLTAPGPNAKNPPRGHPLRYRHTKISAPTTLSKDIGRSVASKLRIVVAGSCSSSSAQAGTTTHYQILNLEPNNRPTFRLIAEIFTLLMMAVLRSRFQFASCIGVLPFLLALSTFLRPVQSANISYVTTTNAQGQTVFLPENRQPALYTGSFGDCLGGSLFDISRFNAAYYQDNMTVIFQLEGSTDLQNASVISESCNKLSLG